MVRKTKYNHKKISTLIQDNTKEVSKNEWNDGHNELGMNGHGAVTTLTISSGSITPIHDMHIIDGEGAADDELSTIDNTETDEFDEIWLYRGAQNITVKHGIGNIFLLSENDGELSITIPIKLIRKGTDWFEVGNNNAIADSKQVFPYSTNNSDYLSPNNAEVTSESIIGNGALSSTGTASATGAWGTFPTSLENCTDDDPDTFTTQGLTSLGDTNPAYIEIDFGSSFTVDKATIKVRVERVAGAGATSHSLEGWNGASWTTLKFYVDLPLGVKTITETVSFTSTSLSKLRFRVAHENFLGVSGLEAYYMHIGELGLGLNVLTNNTSEKWKSLSELSPSVIVDMGSSKDSAAILLNVDKTITTITEIELRASVDNTFDSSETVRTVLIANLSDNIDEFYRFNRLDEEKQFYQIIGTGVGVLALNKFFVFTPADYIRFHRHKNISASNTSLDGEG